MASRWVHVGVVGRAALLVRLGGGMGEWAEWQEHPWHAAGRAGVPGSAGVGGDGLQIQGPF